MRAAILVKQNAPLEIADLELPPLQVGQVLVKLACSGICGKQIDEITGRQGDDPHLPHLLGHEGAGIVAEVGPGVRKVKPGDAVVVHWVKGSGIDSVAPRFTRGDEKISAGWATTFSDHTIASENRVTPVPSGVPFDVLALLGCAVTTGLGIVFNNAALRPGESIAIFGVGGVGLNVVQGASLVSGTPIVAIDVNDAKLELARACGATHTVNSDRQDPIEALRALSVGQGFDAVVDTTGITAVRQVCYDATSRKGRTIFCGVPFAGERMQLDSFPLHAGRRLIGSHGGETVPDVDIPRYIRLYEQGKLDLARLITHRYPLERINDAIETVRRGGAGRVVVTMNGASA
jgi:S-(hydroxymethyl)glutathione dehydrogenase/alcohol dehydrogenase